MAERFLPPEFSTSEEVARILLQAGVFSLNTENGVRLKSGILSPLYTDLRILGSNVDSRTKIVDHFVSKMHNQELPDVIAGVATAGISWGAWVAERMRKPFIFVRPTPKDHGTGKQIEGVIFPEQQAVMIEDVITTGESVLSGVEALRNEGALVDKIYSIMDYQLPDSRENAEKKGVEIQSLTIFPDVLKIAEKEGYWDRGKLATIKEWYKDPREWQAATFS